MSTEREEFEDDAKQMGFDLTRQNLAVSEPWAEYADAATGHRWAGWMAGAEWARRTTSLPAGDAVEPVGYFLQVAPDMWEQAGTQFKDDADVMPLYRAAAPAAPAYTQSTLEEHAAALKAGDLMALAEEAGGNRTAENVVEMTRDDLARIGTDFVRAAAPVAEPMTDRQVVAALVNPRPGEYDASSFLAGVRAAEAHHSIKPHTPTPEMQSKTPKRGV